jgi:uncharacterized membrane protein YbjE (DUF340 family)
MRLRKAVEAMAVVTVVDTDTVGVITAAVMEVGIFTAAAMAAGISADLRALAPLQDRV